MSCNLAMISSRAVSFQQTVGLTRAGHPADDAALGVGRAGINPHRSQCQAMATTIWPETCMATTGWSADCIELGARRVTLFRQQGVIVTETRHPLAAGSQVGLLP